MKDRIDVAVAVIFNDRGQVLWGSRPEGKPYAGYWEFPGGKLEAGETVWQALVRELKEELGLLATAGGPWFVIDHDYEHAKVRLYLYRVWGFEGEPQSLEGQTFKWGALQSSEVSPILPATAPLLPVLSQPAVMAVTDYAGQGQDRMQEQLGVALERSAQQLMVYFREKSLDPVALQKAFSVCHSWCRGHGVPLSINSDSALQMLKNGCTLPPDVHLHLTQQHLLDTPVALQEFVPVGCSVHSPEMLQMAFDKGMRYAVLGAVKATQTHPGCQPLGWDGFKQMTQNTKLPVFAIGGLTWGDLRKAQEYGAHGISMIRGLAAD